MNDTRQIILWFIFGISSILLWEQWQLHNGRASLFSPPPSTTAPAAKPAATGAAGEPTSPAPRAASTAGAPAAAVPSSTPSGEASTPAPSGPGSADSAQRIAVSTDVYQLEFDPVGATLVRAELRQHRDIANKQKNMVLFDHSKERLYRAQTGLALQGDVARPNHLTPMRLTSTQKSLNEGEDTLVVRFEAQAADTRLVKTYTFRRARYDIAVTHEVHNLGQDTMEPTLYLEIARDGNTLSSGAYASVSPSVHTGPVVYTAEKKYQKIEFADIEKNKADFAHNSSAGYVAMVQHYFASAWLLADGLKRTNTVRTIDKNFYAVGMTTQLPPIAAGQTGALQATLYLGPQNEKDLERLYPGLELVKDYGIFAVIAKPLYWLLDKLHDLLGNWGWAIVGLVVVIKAAFYWLNAKAYQSMGKMKAINPRIQEMRERLKDKPQQMQQEMMRIYREEKVNPLGGCLPILVQIPVFFALYSVLLASVEMRGAPWIGWIVDLSEMDPYYILPSLMTASTLLQTWLNPTPPDPMQAKMMWIMPLVFSVMFFIFPAGLVLYWLVNNILSIGQQWLINKRLGVLGKK